MRRRTHIGLLILAALLTACGDSGGPDTGPLPNDATDAVGLTLRDEVEATLDALTVPTQLAPYGVDVDQPWQELKDSEREIFLYGTGGERHKVTYSNRFGRRRSYSVRFEGIVNNLERRYEETDSDAVRERVESYMAEQACPECHGARLRPGHRRRHRSERRLPGLHRCPRALDWGS